VIGISFTPWGRFSAIHDKAAILRFLQDVARTAHAEMRAGMEGPHSGRIYTLRGGRRHTASVDATRREYPATRTGALKGSIRTEVTASSATIGTRKSYAVFLRKGTIKMKRRKMSDTALKAGAAKAWNRKSPFARFQQG
jgi:phage gpG-like protein